MHVDWRWRIVTLVASEGALSVMRSEKLEDRILREACELYDEACLDLRIGRNLQTLRMRLARLKDLTDRLAEK